MFYTTYVSAHRSKGWKTWSITSKLNLHDIDQSNIIQFVKGAYSPCSTKFSANLNAAIASLTSRNTLGISWLSLIGFWSNSLPKLDVGSKKCATQYSPVGKNTNAPSWYARRRSFRNVILFIGWKISHASMRSRVSADTLVVCH
jgi:hypothetical protein